MTARLRQELDVPADDVEAVLSDPWSYAAWVVGASQVREVEGDWPKPGAAIHHSIGAWPLLLNDHTTVERAEPERELVLRAQARPFGAALVRLLLEPSGPDGTALTIQEDVVAGPGRLVPAGVRRVGLVPRNVESLRRLGLIAEGRRGGGPG